jgi:hypothetical protein
MKTRSIPPSGTQSSFRYASLNMVLFLVLVLPRISTFSLSPGHSPKAEAAYADRKNELKIKNKQTFLNRMPLPFKIGGIVAYNKG